MPIVIITPEVLFQQQGPHIEMLRKAGFEVRFPSRGGLTEEAETIEAVREAAATIAGGEPYTERVLAGLPNLRVISRWGVGVDCIDLDAVTRHGVAVAITPGSNHEAVAEHTIALPFFTRMSETQVGYVRDTVRELMSPVQVRKAVAAGR